MDREKFLDMPNGQKIAKTGRIISKRARDLGVDYARRYTHYQSKGVKYKLWFVTKSRKKMNAALDTLRKEFPHATFFTRRSRSKWRAPIDSLHVKIEHEYFSK